MLPVLNITVFYTGKLVVNMNSEQIYKIVTTVMMLLALVST